MKRLLKLLGIVVGAIVVLFILVAVGLAVFVDPNDYKGRIETAVAEQTGRTLTLEGDLTLHLFPTLRLGVGRATLGNAPGFGDMPFAEIGSAELELKLLPLLARRVDVSQVKLDGLVLNLARDAQGRNNWQDIGGKTGAAPQGAQPGAGAPEQTGGGGEVRLDVAEMVVSNSEVDYSDAATKSRWKLSDFDLEASDFGPDRAFPITMDFSVAGPDVKVNVGVSTRATVSLAENRYRLDDLAVKLAGSGARWPGGQGEANLKFTSLAADLGAESVDLKDLTVTFLGVTAKGSLAGRQLLSNLSLGGQVEIEPFDPSAVLDVFGAKIQTADPDVLKHASAKAMFVYDANRIGLDKMTLALDDSSLTGNVAVQNGKALRFDLAVDQINADRYLPPPEEGAPAEQDEGSLDAVDLPVDVLRTVDASGKFALGKAQFAGMSLSDAAFTLTAKDGHVAIKPTAKLYGGNFAGDVKLDVAGDAVKLTYGQQLAGVDMASLGKDLLGSQMISGTGSVNLNLTSTGSNVGQMRRDLDGDMSFTIKDGALEGLDLWYELRRARALLNKADAPAKPEGPPRTPFSSVSASGVVADAVVMNKDLNATLPFMTVDGKGTVNLLNSNLDFDLVATVLDNETVKSDPLMSDLVGQKLPLVVGGTIDAPSVKPDFQAIVRARAQREIEQQKGEQQQKLEEKKQEAQDKLKNRLRGLLDR
ncbi:MAG TPA: AsmA family protein [Gammaproteobacteria bacterium]|nr:AsmA family protein [Gammaproteobacteria bacterium]